MDIIPDSVESLRHAWDSLREENPRLRIRDAAQRLNISEAELLATKVGRGVTRLAGDWGKFLQALPELGHIMALTRNEYAVHERKGYYRNVSVNGPMGLVLDEEIDLRVFLNHWHFGFAVEEEMRGELHHSLQIFDRDGVAVHKIFMQEDGDMDAYRRLVERFYAEDQTSIVAVEPKPAADTTLPDHEIDYEGLYTGWRALQDTHDFFGLLNSFKVSRIQALRNADSDLAVEVASSALRSVLELAAANQTAIMIFVDSPGVIQIHGGPVTRIVVTEPWVNVLDDRFNLHLREDAIASAWVVRKPTRDGVVTSLELFDKNNSPIAILFGKRKPGMAELSEWRDIIHAVEQPIQSTI